MQDHIVKKIVESQEILSTKKELQSFLGIINQVREFVPKLSHYTIPLNKKLKKDIQFEWTKEDEKALQKIKELCSNLPKLSYPDDTKNFTWIVETDASEVNHSWGATLKYKYTNCKIEYLCRYTSGTFKNSEINWDINKKELKAVKNGLKAFEPYVVFNKFILRIDNSTVKSWINKSSKLENSIVKKEINRLITDIKLYDYDIELVKTTDNILADKLSRNYGINQHGEQVNHCRGRTK